MKSLEFHVALELSVPAWIVRVFVVVSNVHGAVPFMPDSAFTWVGSRVVNRPRIRVKDRRVEDISLDSLFVDVFLFAALLLIDIDLVMIILPPDWILRFVINTNLNISNSHIISPRLLFISLSK